MYVTVEYGKSAKRTEEISTNSGRASP